MASPAAVEPVAPAQTVAPHPRFEPGLVFQTLLGPEPSSNAGKRASTLTVSFGLHAVLVACIVVIPLLSEEIVPIETTRAFFVTPHDLLAPPPPPPPPAASSRMAHRKDATPPAPTTGKLVAPVEVPMRIVPETGIDLGVEGGVPGGVEGGVPGGVVGGIVGGLPTEAPTPPPPVIVRIGGQIKAPKLIHKVPPEYPLLATNAHVQGTVTLEAVVDANGYVKSVRVVEGNPLLEDAALAAVKQWRYAPLLLNGVPTEFILGVTIVFHLSA